MFSEEVCEAVVGLLQLFPGVAELIQRELVAVLFAEFNEVYAAFKLFLQSVLSLTA